VEKKQVEYKLQLPEKIVLPFISILKIIFWQAVILKTFYKK